jgi:hypothetical protein
LGFLASVSFVNAKVNKRRNRVATRRLLTRRDRPYVLVLRSGNLQVDTSLPAMSGLRHLYDWPTRAANSGMIKKAGCFSFFHALQACSVKRTETNGTFLFFFGSGTVLGERSSPRSAAGKLNTPGLKPGACYPRCRQRG